jgi:hypothetical protein
LLLLLLPLMLPLLLPPLLLDWLVVVIRKTSFMRGAARSHDRDQLETRKQKSQDTT